MKEIPLNLKGKLFCSPMPYGIFDYNNKLFLSYLKNNIDTVVNLTERDEYLNRSKKDLKKVYEDAGLNEINFPICDFNIPKENIESLITNIISILESGKNVVIHCFAGLGRTGLISSVVTGKILKLSGVEAIGYINSILKNKSITTPEQKKFIINQLDKLENSSETIKLSEYKASSTSSNSF